MYLSANDGHIYVAPIAGGTRSALPTTRAAFTSCTVSARMARRWLSSSSCAQICRLPVGSHSYRQPEARLAIRRLAAATSTARSIRPTALGCISTPRSHSRRATRNWPDARRRRPHGTSRGVGDGRLVPTPRRTASCRIYISFPPGTSAIRPTWTWRCGWFEPQIGVMWRFPLFGGQGTINVNSWSPDSRRFAFVAYPVQQA